MLISAIQIQSIVPSLLVFEVSNQRIGDKTAKAISDLLTELGCKLETLDLTCCEFTGVGIAVICKALAGNTTVKNLRLGWNPLGREGGLAVVDMLNKNTTLESIELCNTSLDTAAIIHLYSALRDHPSLLNVDLQKSLLYSRQEDTNVHAAQMLCCNKVLTTLNLAHSQVGDLGADVLSKALFRNNALRVLCLANNQIGKRFLNVSMFFNHLTLYTYTQVAKGAKLSAPCSRVLSAVCLVSICQRTVWVMKEVKRSEMLLQ